MAIQVYTQPWVGGREIAELFRNAGHPTADADMLYILTADEIIILHILASISCGFSYLINCF